MFLRMTVLALATCSLALTACSNKKNEKKVVKTIDTQAILSDSTLSNQDKSERLALAAEQLVSPGSFMYAQDVLEQSLSIDKDNKRAQLVQALIAPMMATKGIMARIQPLSEKTEEGKAKYADALTKLESEPTHALKNFLLDGKADIKTEKDIQSFVDSIRNEFNKQRLFFKNNKDLEMTFSIADLFSVAALSREEACYWVYENKGVIVEEGSDEGEYVQYCDESNEPVVLQYKLNRADNETIQQIVAGYQVYITLLNAYNLDGSIDVALANKDVEVLDKSFIREELLKTASFGTLRTTAALNSIRSLGLDAVSGVRWVSQQQKELCAAGESSKENRPGYVINKGLCLKDREEGKESISEILATIELALNGSALKQTFTGDLAQYTTQVKTTAINGSIKDVRSLGLKFNGCGDVIGAGDSTLGGTFPMKDANIVLNLNSKKCVQ